MPIGDGGVSRLLLFFSPQVQQSSFYGYTGMLPKRYTQGVMTGESEYLQPPPGGTPSEGLSSEQGMGTTMSPCLAGGGRDSRQEGNNCDMCTSVPGCVPL